jgi:hypothetical protein
MMKQKEFGRKWSWLNGGSIRHLPEGTEEMHYKPWDSGDLAESRIKHLREKASSVL